MSHIKIQPANALDFIAIAALDRIAWKEGPESEFIPDGEHVWRVWTEHALTFIARDNYGDLIGVVLAFSITPSRSRSIPATKLSTSKSWLTASSSAR